MTSRTIDMAGGEFVDMTPLPPSTPVRFPTRNLETEVPGIIDAYIEKPEAGPTISGEIAKILRPAVRLAQRVIRGEKPVLASVIGAAALLAGVTLATKLENPGVSNVPVVDAPTTPVRVPPGMTFRTRP